MLTYVLLKFGRAVLVVWGAFTATYCLLYVLPASPAELFFPPDERDSIDPEVVAQINHMYGFDLPWWQQYLSRVWRALHFDFGTSISNGQEVSSAIGDVLPNTIQLALVGIALATIFAFGIAWFTTYVEWPWLRNAIATVPPLLVSLPGFLLALLILRVFSFQLGWFPPVGSEGFNTLILPAISLAIPVSGPIAQLLLRNFLTEHSSPYVLTAYSKGLRKGRVIRTEVLRNSSLPALTQVGIITGELLAGAVLIETIYSRAGLGRLMQQAVQVEDIPVVQGVVVFVALVFATVNFLVDIAYPLVDPRLRVIPERV